MSSQRLEKKKAGREPARKLFEDGTYDINEFHDIFIELADMTEYKPAIQLCGTWKEWVRLKRDFSTLNAYIAEWKEELEVKLRSEAVQKIIQLSKGDDPKALQAARFLSESGYNKRAGAGRPSKAEKEREVKELARAASDTAAEEQRVLSVLTIGIH